jgi:hypothetical protein
MDGDHFTRTIADMTALHPLNESDGFHALLADYEVRTTERTKAFPQVFVCVFDVGVFGGDILIASMKSHPDTWMDGYTLARLPPAPGRQRA